MQRKRYGLGWRPQPQDARDRIFGSASALGEWLDLDSLRKYAVEIYDQKRSSACVAFSIKMAVQIRERVKGLPYDEAAAFFLYVLSMLHANRPLRDNGLYPRDALKAAYHYGITSAGMWPDIPSNVLRHPSMTALMSAQPRRGGHYESIPGGSSETGELIKLAIGRGLPVIGGFQVGSEWFSAQPGQVLEPQSSSVGGHMICIVGKGSVPDTYEFANSWGKAWCDGGFGLLSAHYVEKHASDLTVVDGWKRIARVEK